MDIKLKLTGPIFYYRGRIKMLTVYFQVEELDATLAEDFKYMIVSPSQIFSHGIDPGKSSNFCTLMATVSYNFGMKWWPQFHR